MTTAEIREEFIEQAWQELAVQLGLNSKHLGWFKNWFSLKMSAACGKMVGEEKGRHARTQEWLDKFQGELGKASLEIAKIVQQCGEQSATISRLQRELREKAQ